MKKQRKNTISRDAAERNMPREERKETKKRVEPSDKGSVRSRKTTSRNKKKADSGKKEYFQDFYKENTRKRKEDFKIKKDKKAPQKPDRTSSVEDKKERRARKPKWTKEQKIARDIKLGLRQPEKKKSIEEKMPLNKYLSRAGICSRREAAALIKAGEVKVNGVVHKEPGYKVVDGDIVTYQDQELENQEKTVYFLLNKAKDYITTTDDPEGRKTVMDLFSNIEERIFPVGRLDRNTTGLLLLTNDGQLAQKLSHPKFNNKKVYQVKLDKELEQEHFETIQNGLELEDGKAIVDSLAYINPERKNEIGIEIHIGKNRIVRRIFEHLGYQVKHLDRVMYAGLTKKNLPRGKWRALTDKEIIFLKHFK